MVVAVSDVWQEMMLLRYMTTAATGGCTEVQIGLPWTWDLLQDPDRSWIDPIQILGFQSGSDLDLLHCFLEKYKRRRGGERGKRKRKKRRERKEGKKRGGN